MSTDPRIDAYIEKQADFAKPILAWIRERMHAALPEVEETVKWSHPFFYYQGKPLAHMAGFKAHAHFGFWDRANNVPMKDDEAAGERARFTSLADLPDAATIEANIRAAAATVESGQKPARAAPKPRGEIEVPPELAEALAGDGLAAQTFDNFPPSCRREYCEWVAEAKRPETKAKRVADTIAWLREGKRRNWKYENC